MDPCSEFNIAFRKALAEKRNVHDTFTFVQDGMWHTVIQILCRVTAINSLTSRICSLNPSPFLPHSQAIPASIPGHSHLNLSPFPPLKTRPFPPQSQAIPTSQTQVIPTSQTQAIPASIPGHSHLKPRPFPQSQTIPASIPGHSCLNPRPFLLQS